MGKLFDFSSTPTRPATTMNSTSVTPTPPPIMPDAQSPMVAEAERQKRAQIMQRGGRTSTILSEAVDSSSSGDSGYSSKKLG